MVLRCSRVVRLCPELADWFTGRLVWPHNG
jgi:hypothetical protein